jgi:HEPN domain-containing protein
MKNPRETARRWLEQAEHDLEVVRLHVEKGFWSDACFMAEQTVQVALKAYLYGQGERFIPIHSVYELALECERRNSAFTPVVEWGKVLDKYYIPARYPDALAPPAVPYKSFTEKEATEAVSYADNVTAIVKANI